MSVKREASNVASVVDFRCAEGRKRLKENSRWERGENDGKGRGA